MYIRLKNANNDMSVFKCIKYELKYTLGCQDDGIECNVNLKTGKMLILEYRLEYSNIDMNCIIK